MTRTVYPGRTLSTRDVAINVAVLAMGAIVTFQLLFAGPGTRIPALVVGGLLVAYLVVFVYRFAKAGESLKVDPRFVVFGGKRVPLEAIQSVERGPADPDGPMFWVYLHTSDGRHTIDFGRYRMDRPEQERVFEALRNAVEGGEGA